MSIYKEVYKKIDDLQENIIAYAIDLVRFPTVSGKELEAQIYIKEVLKDLNFDTIDMWEPDIEELKNHEAFISQRNNFHNSPNVVGVLKGADKGKSLLLSSHIDIVPEGNHKEWKYPPFKGVVDKGKIYGRGISDMKGTNSAFFGVIKAFQELNIKLKGDIIFQSVIEEETGCAGSLASALRGYKADAAIVPEMSDLKICPAQQGSLWFRIIIEGSTYHGASRYLGVSAIEKAYLIITALKELEKIRDIKYAHPLFEDRPILYCINIGKINGGNWPSVVPGEVTIEGRMGIPPRENLPDARHMFEKWIDNTAEKDPWLKQHKPRVEWIGSNWGSSEINHKHPIVELAKKAYTEVLNKEPQISGTPWGTDGRMLTEFAGTPSLVFGPGSSAHCADEFMEINKLMNYSKILTKIMLDWCGFIKITS